MEQLDLYGHHAIPIKYFWRLLVALIILISAVAGFLGYYAGISDMEQAVMYGHDRAIKEYPSIMYDYSRKAYCADGKGTFYYVTKKKDYFIINKESP